jgi:precorrin-6x reductase
MTLLLLAGTGDAKRIAWGLVDTSIKVIASLAGATRAPDPLPVPTRIGGFGGEDGFRDYLRGSEITAVLDATHPFAAQISDRTARICGELGLPYAQFVRPVWTPEDGDNWITIAAPVDAVNHIANGSTVFLATGRQTLAEYANLAGRRVLVRVIDPADLRLPNRARRRCFAPLVSRIWCPRTRAGRVAARNWMQHASWDCQCYFWTAQRRRHRFVPRSSWCPYRTRSCGCRPSRACHDRSHY